MARPRHEDPEFQRHVIGTYRQSLLRKAPVSIRYCSNNLNRPLKLQYLKTIGTFL